MTTGIVPDGAGRALELRQRLAGDLASVLLDVDLVEQLPTDRAPDRLVAGLHAGVADGDALHGEQRLDLIVLGEHPVAVGDEDAAPAVGHPRRDLLDGGALRPSGLVGPGQQRDLGRLLDVLGQHGDLVGPAGVDPAEGDRAVLAGRASRRGGGRFGRGPQPGFGQIGGVGESGRLADDDADAGAPVASGAQLLDPAVVEPGRRGPPVLDEDLGEVAARAQRRAENALNYGGVEH